MEEVGSAELAFANQIYSFNQTTVGVRRFFCVWFVIWWLLVRSSWLLCLKMREEKKKKKPLFLADWREHLGCSKKKQGSSLEVVCAGTPTERGRDPSARTKIAGETESVITKESLLAAQREDLLETSPPRHQKAAFLMLLWRLGIHLHYQILKTQLESFRGKLVLGLWNSVLWKDEYNIEDCCRDWVSLLSRIHHRNLVQFLGCCQEEGQRILIYEFMHNGTLKEHLYVVLLR